MTISWYGHSCFKITNRGGHLAIITDPFDKGLGLSVPRSSADIVTVSTDKSDHNNIQAVSGTPFLVDGPGEYEVKGIRIFGCSSLPDKKESQDKKINTIYLIEMEKIRICHLGCFNQERLENGQLEAIGQVDILIIPVGGHETIGGKEAVRVVEQIEPHLVIPMHYKLPGLKKELSGLDGFLKERGLNNKTTLDKLVLKKRDLTGKEMEVVVLKV